MYESYAERIRSFCARRLDDPHEAADAVQDTFLRAWLALRNGTQVRYPLPWLLTIADNVCVSRFRARGARIATTALSAEERVELPEPTHVTAGLAAALRALPDRQREALLRRELQGYSYDEIGAELGVSRASVAALLHRARLTVADRLSDARRGVAALVPTTPAFLRTFVEGGGAHVAAGAAAVAIAVAPLAGLSPASPASPSPSADAAALVLGAHHVVSSTVQARPSSRAVTHATTGTSPAGGARVQVIRAGGHFQLGATYGLEPEPVPATPVPAEVVPAAQDLPTGDAAPAGGTDTLPSVDGTEPGGEPAGEPALTAGGDEQREEDAAADDGRSDSRALPPGHQPKGERGRSAYAPGHTKSDKSPEGQTPGVGHGKGGSPEKEERQPPSETDKNDPARPEDTNGETGPTADAPGGSEGAGQQQGSANDDTAPNAQGKGEAHGQEKEGKGQP